MCRYRYYFYGSCRHCEVVLLDFCKDAVRIQKSDSSAALVTSSSENERGDDDRGRDEPRQRLKGGAIDDGKTDRLHANATTHSQLSSSTSTSFDRGSRSITAEPVLADSSLPAVHHTHSSPSASQSHDMASRFLFEQAFRQLWPVNAPKSTDIDTSAHMSMTENRTSPSHRSVRQPGIRYNTDESWDLPTSNDIIQHLAESPHSRNKRHVGIDGQRASSCASTAALQDVSNDHMATHDSYNCIEAEIDQLKEDIMRLKQDADKGRATQQAEQGVASDSYVTIRRGQKPATLAQSGHESAAARLQRLHEANTTDGAAATGKQPAARKSPSPLEFPSLSEVKPTALTEATLQPIQESRKPSYAEIASNGMMAAIGKGFSSTAAKCKDIMLHDWTTDGSESLVSVSSQVQTLSTAATQDSSEHREDGDSSVVITPCYPKAGTSAGEAVTTVKGIQSAVSDKPVKRSPHFAQPTQSFSRRTGETTRKEVTGLSLRSPMETTPSKSSITKETKVATNKRANPTHQKRKSLPGNWVGGDDAPRRDSKLGLAIETGDHVTATPPKLSSPASALSPSSAESWQTVKGIHTKENHSPMRVAAHDLHSQSPLTKKKKGSYMSPTTATTQRTIATLGQGKVKQDLAQATSAAQTTSAPGEDAQADERLRSCTLSSDQSSVQFILDRQSPEKGSGDKAANGIHIQLNKMSNRPSKLMLAPTVLRQPSRSPQKRGPRNVSRIPKPTAPHTRNQSEPKATITKTSSPLKSMQLSSLIKNTTTKRRVSRGHVLQPIVKRLHSKGLLQKTSMENALIQSYLEGISVEPDIKESIERSSEHRERVRCSKTDGTDSTEASEQPYVTDAVEHNLSTAEAGSFLQNSAGKSTGMSSDAPTVGMPAATVTGPSSLPQFGASSLRATANEFTPQQLHRAIPDDFAIQSTWPWISNQQWMGMSAEEKRSIVEQRRLQGIGGDHKRLAQRSWANIAASSQPYDPTVKFVDNNGSPREVHAGQILKPSLTPGKKTVQWMLQDLDGKEKPITFGRAPPPTLSTSFEPSTPDFSPTSDDTSPPNSHRTWHIGSALSRAPYAWTGGDGKEIRFVGYGPHAERDPNNVVNFNFQGRTASYNVSVPNGFSSEDKENCPDEGSFVPKSQKQWAELIGYPKVPCGNVEVVGASEFCAPRFGERLEGFCHECVP